MLNYLNRHQQYSTVSTLIQITYLWLLICFIIDISHWIRLSPIIVPYDLSIFFLSQNQHEWNLTIIWGLYFSSLILGCFFNDKRYIRVLIAIFGLMYLAIFRSVNPGWNAKDTGIILSCWYVFLPDNWDKTTNRKSKEHVLTMFVGGQLIVLLPYFISGTQKLLGSILWSGPDTFFLMLQSSPLSSFYLADDAILNPYLVQYRALLWFGLWVLATCMITSPLVIVRPYFQPIWAFILGSFHLLSGFTLQIFYAPQFMLLVLYFVLNPFIHNGYIRLIYKVRYVINNIIIKST